MTYPTIRPALTLDFEKSKKLDPRITFTRSSTATYLDAATGLIKTAPSGVARFEKEGLLAEEARTNIIRESTNLNNTSEWNTSVNPGSINQASNQGWMVATANTTEIVAPDGTYSACKLSGNTASINDKNYRVHVIPKDGTHSMAATTVYSYSVFINDPDGVIDSRYVLEFQHGSKFSNTNGRAEFDLVNNTVTYGYVTNSQPGKIESYPNGWKKLTATFDSASAGGPRFSLREITPLTNNVTQFSANGEKFYVWGFQIEEGSFPTSYIPTSGTTVPRSADVTSITGTNFSSWFTFGDHTTLAEWNRDDINQRVFVYRYMQAANQSAEFLEQMDIDSNNVVDVNTWFGQKSFGNAIDINGKAALAVTDGDASFAVGGSLIAGSTRAPSSGPTTRMVIGWNDPNGQYFNGHISRILFYPTRVSDASLQELTS